jgi:hypothetical protein
MIKEELYTRDQHQMARPRQLFHSSLVVSKTHSTTNHVQADWVIALAPVSVSASAFALAVMAEAVMAEAVMAEAVMAEAVMAEAVNLTSMDLRLVFVAVSDLSELELESEHEPEPEPALVVVLKGTSRLAPES